MLRIKWHLKDFRNRFISVFVMANKYKLLWHISKIYVFIFEQFINACFMILVGLHVVNIFKIIIFRYRGQLRQVIPRMWPAFIPSHEGHHLPAKFPARRSTFGAHQTHQAALYQGRHLLLQFPETRCNLLVGHQSHPLVGSLQDHAIPTPASCAC